MSVRVSTLEREIVALLEGGPMPPAEISRKLWSQWGDALVWAEFVRRVTQAANNLKLAGRVEMHNEAIRLVGSDLI